MKQVKDYFLLLCLALFLLFFDGQFSYFLTTLTGRSFIFTSHFLLLYLIFLYLKGTYQNIVIAVFIFVFLIADLYYLNFIGVYLLALLLLLSILHALNKSYLDNPFYIGLTFFLGTFFFDFASYGLALLFGLSSQSLFTFVTYSLAPSLFLNTILFILIYIFVRRFK